ncbi:MAG: NAD(P)H-binding protein [Bacteroidetes bacterium]|nr:NAD(P)H-binding protein [Bacteroidota bacterium]
MKIIIAGSLGNVSQPLVKKLIAAGHEVTVITSSPERQISIEALGAHPALGSVNDATFLTQTFKDADAVYTMTPPAIGGENIIENIASAGRAYARAIEQSNVPRVVMLSSIGADAPEGTGPIKGVHLVEQTFQKLKNADITILRAGNFYYNFFRDIPMIKNRQIIGNNYNGDDKLLLAHPEDIAEAAAEELQHKGNGIEIKYIVSDISTGNEVAKTLGQAIGKSDLPWVTFPDDQLKQGMSAAGLPQELIDLLIEMGQALRAGIVTKDFFASGEKVTGKIKLEQFAEEFKTRYFQN